MFSTGFITSILLLLINFLLIIKTEANTAAQCVQFGVNNILYDWTTRYGNPQGGLSPSGAVRKGYWTIGTKEFDNKWVVSIGSRYEFVGDVKSSFVPGAENSPCPWKWNVCPGEGNGCVNDNHRLIDLCVDNSYIQIRTYVVKQQGRILHGWLHVEIELMDPNDEMALIYIQMRDEAFNAIGEFVTHENYPGAKCRPSNDRLSSPTYYQLYPCSSTGLREAKTSQAILMANKEDYFDKSVLPLIHEKPIHRGVHFVWKMDEYWCSRHQKIQPFAYVLTKRNQELYSGAVNGGGQWPKILRKVPNFWLHPKWFGASDIIFKKDTGDLDCSQLAIDDNSGEVTQVAQDGWFSTSSRLVLREDSWYPPNRYEVQTPTGLFFGTKLCQADPIDKRQTESSVPTFSGRCKHHFEKDVSRSFYHGCNLNPKSNEFAALNLGDFEVYSKYNADKKAKRVEFCSLECKTPKTAQDFEDMKAFPTGNVLEAATEFITVGINDERSKAKVAKFWIGRKYHGIMCTIVAMFVSPVCIFLARYYKETFMRKHCSGTPCWYWVHSGGMISIAGLFASSYSAIAHNFPVWGRSLHEAAIIHRAQGYLSIFLYILLVLWGLFRGGLHYDGRGKCSRCTTVLLHSIFGFFQQYLNMVAILSSNYIPLSPTLSNCTKKSGRPEGVGKVPLIALGAMLVDVIFHLSLSIAQCIIDKKYSIRRGFWCPIVPLLRANSDSDLQGSKGRKIILIVYLIITLSLTIGSVGLIITAKLPKSCRMGPMSCMHVFGCTEMAIRYEEWYFKRGGTIEDFVRN